MKTHHRIFAAILTMAVVCVGCAEKQERSDGPHQRFYEAGGRFSYDPPAKWEIASMPGLKYRIARGPRTGGFTPNINVVEESFTGSLEAYANGNITNMKKLFKSMKILSREDFKTNDDQPAVKLVIENVQQGMKLRQTFYFLGTGRSKFVVTCTAPAKGGAKLDSLFEKSAATFRFHK